MKLTLYLTQPTYSMQMILLIGIAAGREGELNFYLLCCMLIKIVPLKLLATLERNLPLIKITNNLSAQNLSLSTEKTIKL